ncbi:MAG TPA: hypothetical protein VMU50_17035 [Polyangia bacterium]|nr:hypothetical protein [Polyangia bacterium]
MHRAPIALVAGIGIALDLIACSGALSPRAGARDAAPGDVASDGAGLPGDTSGSAGDAGQPGDAAAGEEGGGFPSSADASADGPPIPCAPAGDVVTWTRGKVRLDYDLVRGTASFFYDGVRKVADFYAAVDLPARAKTTMYRTRACVVRGDESVVTSTGDGLPTLEQSFVLDGGDKFLARLTVKGAGLATNWISPVVMDTAGGVDVAGAGAGDVRVLDVPFDNDAWIAYDAHPIAAAGTSYEVSAVYDNQTRNGIVVGSVTHDTWKTGISHAGSNDRLDALTVFGGASDKGHTRDVLPHGKVKGDAISSPTVFVGYAPDWRDLMEEYAQANLAVRPALPWSGGVPFGWNSWGQLQTKVSFDKAIGVADFIKQNLQSTGFSSDGTVYINLDSYWDNLSSAQLDAFVAHCHANGQKAGIYWSPFVDWGKTGTSQVDGTKYVYSDVWLRDAAGKPIELDTAYAIDPTHPGTKGRIDKFIDDFRRRGFEYVKLDFLTHGSLESSVRFDAKVQTGIQAFNQGMQYIVDRIGGTMFISASIAPLFPYGYAHSRRVACDTYGAANGLLSTHYQMNSATYGWWMNGTIYRFNDPDEMVFEGFTPTDNMSRLISGVVSGTVFLIGDDLTQAPAQALARANLTNERINAVARLGKAFRPVEGNTGTDPSNVLVLHDGDVHYVAVFNFAANAANESIDLARAGLDGATDYAVIDLWSGEASTARQALPATVAAGSARLYSLR